MEHIICVYKKKFNYNWFCIVLGSRNPLTIFFSVSTSLSSIS